MIFLLRSKEYFNVQQSELGRISNDLMFYMILTTMIGSLFCGVLYDILGRVWTIFFSILLSSILIALTPYASNIYYSLILIRVGIGIFMIAPNCHPLVTDYVRYNYRGRVTAYQNLGQILGELFTYSVLFTLSEMYEFKACYMIVAVIAALGSIALFFMLKEPDMGKIHEAATP